MNHHPVPSARVARSFRGVCRGALLLVSLGLLVTTACITSIDQVTVTGVFRDPAGSQQVLSDDVYGTIYVGSYVAFSYNPNYCEEDPPRPQDRISVSYTLIDVQTGSQGAVGGAIDTTAFANGDYDIVAHAYAWGGCDLASPADSAPYRIRINNAVPLDPEPKRSPDKAQQPVRNPTARGDDVLMHSGEFVYRETDLTIPCRGIAVSFDRTYRSQLLYNGPMGYGWDFRYNQRLYVRTDGKVIFLNGEGLILEFSSDPETNTYTAPAGVYAVLVKNEDGSFTLRERLGEKRQFNSSGRLTALEDRIGNRVVCEYDSANRLVRVRDTIGRAIDLTYTTSNKIATVTDFTGRQVAYEYDGDGNLTGCTLPASSVFTSGRKTTYTYSSGQADVALNHKLLTITDPTGQTFLENSYDSNDQVVGQRFASGTFVFEYHPDQSKTKVTHRDGTQEELTFDSEGHALTDVIFSRGLQPGDPSQFTTRFTYNPHGEILRTILPRGNETAFVFDDANTDRLAQGNLLRASRKAGTLGSGAELVTTYSYEPRFQQIKTLVDARGNDPAYGPPSRYQTTLYYDYEEGSGGLGQDLNVDGRTDQDKGLLVKVVSPSTRVVDSTGQATGSRSVEARLVYDDQGQLIRQVLPTGSIRTFEYYPATVSGDPTSREGYVRKVIRDAQGVAAITVFDMDPLGRPLVTTDPNGKQRQVEYSPSDQVMKMIDPAPFLYERRYEYDGNDDLVCATTQNVRSDDSGQNVPDPALPEIKTSFTYNQARKVVSVSHTVSATHTATIGFTYDANDRLNRLVSSLGSATSLEYDERGLVLSSTRGVGSPQEATTRFSYSLNGRLEKLTDPRGNSWTVEYDAFDRPILRIDPQGARVATVFDPVDNPERIDVFDRASLGGQSLFKAITQYDEASRPILWRVPILVNGAATGEAVSVIQRDSGGRPIRTINPNGHAVDLTWDGLDRLVTVRDGLGNQVVRTFDPVGNLLQSLSQELAPAGAGVQVFAENYEYDSLNRLIRSIDNAGRTRRVAYDSRSNVVFTSDANGPIMGSANGPGNAVRNFYDGGGRRVRVVQDQRACGVGNGSLLGAITTSYQYDDDNRLVGLIDDNGARTSYSYDALDQVVGTRYADGSQETAERDANGNIVRLVQRNGTIVTSTYDENNRATNRSIARATDVEGTAFESSSYDGLGRALLLVNDQSTIERQFDSLGRLIRELQNGKTVSSTYDPAGNRKTLKYPGQRKIAYGHDVLDRIERITDTLDSAPLATFQYAGPSRLSGRKCQNGTSMELVYDAVRRIETIIHRVEDRGRHPNGPKVFSGFQYVFDREDNQRAEIRLKCEPHAPRGYGLDTGSLYEYDSAYRLTGVKAVVKNPVIEQVNPGTNRLARKTDYQLDGVGNWLKVTKSLQLSLPDRDAEDVPAEPLALQKVVTNYLHNSLNQVVEASRDQHHRPYRETFRYDRNGNRTQDGSFDYRYDYRGQIVRALERSKGTLRKEVAFAYDVLGRRIKREVRHQKVCQKSAKDDKGGKDDDDRQRCAHPPDSTLFFYDGDRLIEEQSAAGRTLRTYVHGAGVGSVLSMDVHSMDVHKPASASGCDRRGDRYFYHASLLGSVSEITDDKGHVVEAYRYSPYGVPSLQPGAYRSCFLDEYMRQGFKSRIGNPFLFGGQRYEEEIGLYDLRLRDYDPDVGQFLQGDPLGMLGGVNLYAYCGSDPVNWIDPLGLSRKAQITALNQARDAALQAAGMKRAWLTAAYFLNALQVLAGNPDILAAGFAQAWGSPDIAGNLAHAGASIVGGFAGAVLGSAMGPVGADVGAGLGAQFASDLYTGQMSSASDYARSVSVGILTGGLIRSFAVPPAISQSEVTLSSPGSLRGVEPASSELIQAVASKRTVTFAVEGSEELRYLDYIGAEANVGGENMTHIILRENPSKAAVLEEFLHGTQQRLGIVNRLGAEASETQVKDFMIRHQKLLNLAPEDVRRLEILRDAGL